MSPFYLLCFSNVFKHESLSTRPAASIRGHVFFFSMILPHSIFPSVWTLKFRKIVVTLLLLMFVFRTNSSSSSFFGYYFFIYSFSLSFFLLFIFQFSLIIFILVFCTCVFLGFFLLLFLRVHFLSSLFKKKISFPILPTKLEPEARDTRSPRSHIHEIVSLQEVSNATAQNVPTKQFCLNSRIFAIFKDNEQVLFFFILLT